MGSLQVARFAQESQMPSQPAFSLVSAESLSIKSPSTENAINIIGPGEWINQAVISLPCLFHLPAALAGPFKKELMGPYI
jgi:hypothetical protein